MGKMKGPNFDDVHIEGFGTGVSMPANAQANFGKLTIKGCQTAIDLRDPPSLFAQLGLPANTPPDLLLEALQLLNGPAVETLEHRERKLEKSRLFRWLGAGAGITTISQGLIQFSQSGVSQDAIEFLKRLAAP